MARFLTAALFAAAARAHFTLDYPATIGFNDDKEPTGPCGGFTPALATDNVTDFYVGGDNVALRLLHPQGTWLIRGTLDTDAAAFEGDGAANWTQLFPETLQTGLGSFCEPAVTAPASWAGKQGVLGVVVDAPDGLLFQCAAVRFVSGVAPAQQATCTNSSGVTASTTTDANLAALFNATIVGGGSGGSSGSGSTAAGTATTSATGTAATGTTTGASSSPSAKSAAGRLAPAASVALAVLGCAYALL